VIKAASRRREEERMSQWTVSVWANVDEGCPISCSVSGSNLARLMIGDNQLEVDLDAEALREMVRRSTAALAEMDTLFEREEAERAAQKPAELSA
jgi:hypothetical protein